MNIIFLKKGYKGNSISIINITDLLVQGFICMGKHRDTLIPSKAISYSKLFNKLAVRTQAFNGRTGILNFIVQGFSLLFKNNIKSLEMIPVNFNTTLDGYYQNELGSSNCLRFSSFTGKKIVLSEVLLTHKALT